MTTIQWLITELETWAPPTQAEPYDNVGLLIGDASSPVKKILIALDATDGVINEAISGNYNCIVTHHPLFRDPLKTITTACPTGEKIVSLLKNEISLYTAHTNLDKAPGGVGDALAEKIFGEKTSPALVKEPFCENTGFGRIVILKEETTLADLLNRTKAALDLSHIRYSGCLSTKIKKAALCGGSGMSFWQTAKAENCDVYITGDIRHHDALNALDAGLSLIDVTHFTGENVIIDAIVTRLRKKAAQDGLDLEITATSVNAQPFYTQ